MQHGKNNAHSRWGSHPAVRHTISSLGSEVLTAVVRAVDHAVLDSPVVVVHAVKALLENLSLPSVFLFVESFFSSTRQK